MANYTISKIKLPNGDVCNLKDTWRGIQDNLTSSSNTTESLSAKQGYLLANGSARDSTKVSKSGDRMTGDLIIGETSSDGTVISSGSFKIGAKNDNYGIMPFANNWNSIGSSSLNWYRSYVMNYYGTTSYITNWASNNNIGTAASSSAASVKGLVNFYNECAAGGTQTKTALQASANSNITLTLPNTTGTLALTSSNITGNAANVTGIVADDHIASSIARLASPAFTGTPTAPTAANGTNTTQIATTAFVMNAFTANDAMIFKGVVNANSDLPTTHYQGWTYKVATAGTYANKVCEVGDMIICVTDGTSANNDHWAVIQNNVDGAVFKGANSFTDSQVLIADGTTGKIKTSGYTIATSVPANAIFTDHYAWSEITGKPSTFTPAAHDHNNDYPLKTATTIAPGKATKLKFPSTFQCTIGANTSNGGARAFYKASGYGVSTIRITIFELAESPQVKYYIPDDEESIIFCNQSSSNTQTLWIVMDAGNLPTITTDLTIPDNPSYLNHHILTELNYTDYTVKKDGTGASGNWGINITGTANTATNLAAKPSLATSGTTQITVTAGGKTSDAYTVPYATIANYPNGFTSRSATASWGNTTGTCVTSWNGGDGCEIAFFKNNPVSGQLSIKIDGTIYIKEGAQDISAAVKSFSVSGQTVTYTNLWGGTGTFTTQDTKNTAGSTNSTSKLFLIGATSQAANPTTNSYQYTYTNNGLLSALKLGLNLNGTEKVHLEWNNTDQSIDFIFN